MTRYIPCIPSPLGNWFGFWIYRLFPKNNGIELAIEPIKDKRHISCFLRHWIEKSKKDPKFGRYPPQILSEFRANLYNLINFWSKGLPDQPTSPSSFCKIWTSLIRTLFIPFGVFELVDRAFYAYPSRFIVLWSFPALSIVIFSIFFLWSIFVLQQSVNDCPDHRRLIIIL